MKKNAIKIKLGLGDLESFCRITNKYDSDVNVYKDKIIVDGKVADDISCLDTSRGIEVELISDNVEDLRRFDSEMCQFGV